MFDSTFPTDKIKELVALIKAGEATSDIPRTLKLALWIAGSSLETFYPMLKDMVFSQSDTVDQLCQNVVAEAPEEGEVSANAISPLLMIAIARLAAKLLQGKC